jgi:pimeloyl-ACP methyl ester carboxylesterase
MNIDFFIYQDTNNIGYVEEYMNQYVFHPPDKKNYKNPMWLKYLKISDTYQLTYFILEPINKNAQYILLSHGNAGDLFSYYDQMNLWYKDMNKAVGIIVYDYQGYGKSSGIPCEKNTYNDLTHMVRHCLLDLKISSTNLYLVGQSLGSGIVVNFCATHNWTTPICLISPYKSISRVMYDPYWLNPANIFLNTIDMYMTQDKLYYVKCHILIYHGTADSLILPYHSEELQSNNPDKITLIMIKKATHNNILTQINLNHMISHLKTLR